MAFDRRDLLRAALAGGAFPFLAPLIDLLEAQAQSGNTAEFDRETYQFWTSQVSQPSRIFYEENRLASSRGNPSAVTQPVEVLCLQNGKFVPASSTDPSHPIFADLMPSGDASVKLAVDAVRPGKSDLQKMIAAKNGSVRVDMKQGAAMQHLAEPLNWSAIFSLFPNAQFSGYRDIQVDPTSTWGVSKSIPITGGIGFCCWNFSMQPKPGMWSEMMQKMMGMLPKTGSASQGEGSAASGAAPSKASNKPATMAQRLVSIEKMVMGIGLPSIATTALQAFDQLFGYMQSSSKTSWILQGADMPVMVSKEARQSTPGRAMALKSGNYVVVGAKDADAIMQGDYDLNDGFIVPKGTANATYDTIQHTAEDISYIAFSTAVSPATKDKNCDAKA